MKAFAVLFLLALLLAFLATIEEAERQARAFCGDPAALGITAPIPGVWLQGHCK